MKKQPAREPYAHAFTVGDSDIIGRIVPQDVGFEVFVPILGADVRFYDDSLDGALTEAQKALDTAHSEFDGLRVTRTDVDGAEAEIVHGNGAPPQLPIRTAGECAAEVHRCQTELAKRTRTFEDAKSAMKAAESAVDLAFEALLEATDREAKPELPLETVTA